MRVYVKENGKLQEEKVFVALGQSFDGLSRLTDSEVEEFYLSKKDGYHLKPDTYPLEWEEDEEITLTTEQKIKQLESQQTARMLRQAALGDADSIDMLQAIEDQIAELRLEL